MADAGRPRLPTAVKERQGTLEKSRTSPQEPVFAEGSPKPPDWLAGDGLAEWNRLVPMLIDQGLFPASAWSQVAGICQHWGKWLEAERAMKVGGRVTESANGYQIASPWVGISEKAWSNYMTGIARFGLDPSSAGKVTARPKGEDQDELSRARAARRNAR